MSDLEDAEDVSLDTWVDGPTGRLMTHVGGLPVPVVDHLRSREAARVERDRERSAEVDVRASLASTCGALDLPVELVDRVLGSASPWRLQRDGGGRLLVLDRVTGLPARDRDGRVWTPVRLLETLAYQDPELLAQASVEARVAAGLGGSATSGRPAGETALAAHLSAEEKVSLGFKPGPPRRPLLRARRLEGGPGQIASGMRPR